jgi:hypothetical protein
MNALRLVRIAKEIEVVEKRLADLKNEGRKILGESEEAPHSKNKPATLSAAQRKKISVAMKQRWAKVKEGASASEKTAGTRSKISAQGLRNIVETQKKRWAKVRAASVPRMKPSAKKGSESSATDEECILLNIGIKHFP